MGILDRLSTILRANINSMLDQAEDPEKTLDQLIRDMADAIGQARGQVAEMIAQEKLLEADMDRNANLGREWGQKAELAISRGAEDLAKEALRRKIDYDNNAHAYASQLQAQQEVVTKLKHDLSQLENKYESAVRNREALIARHRRAVAQQKVAKTAAQLSGMDPSSELGRMEERIRLEEARAAALSEVQRRPTLEDQFAALEGDSELDRQLADLKAKVPGPCRRAARRPACPAGRRGAARARARRRPAHAVAVGPGSPGPVPPVTPLQPPLSRRERRRFFVVPARPAGQSPGGRRKGKRPPVAYRGARAAAVRSEGSPQRPISRSPGTRRSRRGDVPGTSRAAWSCPA